MTLFLKLFLAGPHIVVVHSDFDGQGAVADFRAAFADSLKTSYAIGHSHYVGYSKVALNGLVYPHDVLDPRPLINSLLVDHTSVEMDDPMGMEEIKAPNSFMQLEGWPFYRYYTPWSGGSFKVDKARHLGDYDAHQATKWNISTYGATVYSEKRGTTVFLARAAWNPAPYPQTIMARTQGCREKQSWLDTELVTVQS